MKLAEKMNLFDDSVSNARVILTIALILLGGKAVGEIFAGFVWTHGLEKLFDKWWERKEAKKTEN